MECIECKKEFSADELDTDKLCFACANYDETFSEADVLKIINEFLETLSHDKTEKPKENKDNDNKTIN